MIQRKPSVGSSSIRNRASGIGGIGDRQHLLLAADNLVPACEAVLEIGNGRNLSSDNRRWHDRRQQQILADVEAGENPALLGAKGDPHPRNLSDDTRMIS